MTTTDDACCNKQLEVALYLYVGELQNENTAYALMYQHQQINNT